MAAKAQRAQVASTDGSFHGQHLARRSHQYSRMFMLEVCLYPSPICMYCSRLWKMLGNLQALHMTILPAKASYWRTFACSLVKWLKRRSTLRVRFAPLSSGGSTRTSTR